MNNTHTATAIAAHNDGVLAWLRTLAGLVTEEGSIPRFPALRSAFDRLSAAGFNAIVQTGFLPSGSNAGAKDAEEQVNKPFDVLPAPQAGGTVYGMANPRQSDQDSAVVVAALAALAVTTDDSSTHDWRGQSTKGGGFQLKNIKDGETGERRESLAKVKTTNGTFLRLIKELSVTVDKPKDKPAVYTLPAVMKDAMRRSGVPAFPAEAVKLPIPKSNAKKAATLWARIRIQVTKDRVKETDMGSNDPEAFLVVLQSLTKRVKIGYVRCARESVVDSHSPAFEAAGFRLITPDEYRAILEKGPGEFETKKAEAEKTEKAA